MPEQPDTLIWVAGVKPALVFLPTKFYAKWSKYLFNHEVHEELEESLTELHVLQSFIVMK